MPSSTMHSELTVRPVSTLDPRAEERRAASVRMVTFGGLWAASGVGLGAAALALSGGMVVVGVAAVAAFVGFADLARGLSALRS